MLKIFLWLRYLRKRKIVFLSIAAVALSASLLIVVASLFTGFIRAFENSATDAIGDVIISAPGSNKIADYPVLIDALEQSAIVEAATAMLSAEGLLHLGVGTGNVRPVTIWGIQPARRARVTALKKSLLRQKDLPGEPSFAVAGDADKIGGFVGIGLISEPDEQTDEYDFSLAEDMIGKDVFVTTGTVTETAVSEAGSTKPKLSRRMIRFTVTDVMYTGVYEIDSAFVFLPIEQLQSKLYRDETKPIASEIHMKLRPGADPELAIAVVRGIWETFAKNTLGWSDIEISITDIETARQKQSRYVAELRKQMGVLLVIFGVVSFSVIVLVFCIFYMIVTTKQKDIAIIKSCGTGSYSVAMIFIGFGACVGVIGSGFGAALGYVITRNINTIEGWIRIIFGLKLWKSSVYMFSKIPNEVDWPAVGYIALLATAAAAIGAVIPAIVAARTRPVDLLRYE